MARYEVVVHLSRDFRRTSWFEDGDGFEAAALDGVYDGHGFRLEVKADSHLAAAERAWAVTNSYYPEEMFAPPEYADDVRRYRAEGNRSLSVGDLVMVHNLDWVDGADGRYGVDHVGFTRF